MWAQRYNVSGHYTHHYDWAGTAKGRGGDRLSTFMVYLKAECKGGGTNFPRLRRPRDKRWCEFVDCEQQEGREGVTFKPIKGNAVFWENLRADGSGYPETWHAAFPVEQGEKVGLNIWSWYQPPTGRW
jgi:prolyl 4-hydroxylase